MQVCKFHLWFPSITLPAPPPPTSPRFLHPSVSFIPSSWHLLLCRVLHGWGIGFTQIKQSLCSALSEEMMHVEMCVCVGGASLFKYYIHTHSLTRTQVILHTIVAVTAALPARHIHFLLIFIQLLAVVLFFVRHACWYVQTSSVTWHIAAYDANTDSSCSCDSMLIPSRWLFCTIYRGDLAIFSDLWEKNSCCFLFLCLLILLKFNWIWIF